METFSLDLFSRNTARKLIWVFIGSMSLFWAGCTDHSADDVSPDSGCRLQSYTTTSRSTAPDFIRQERASYTYDAQGNVLKADTTWTQSGGEDVSEGATIGNAAYDAKDYLSSYTSQTTIQTRLATGKVENLKKSLKVSYTYTNGRVTGYQHSATSFYGLTTTSIGTYEYDDAGNLLKQTATDTYAYDPGMTKEIPQYPSGRQRTWHYRNGQLVEYTEQTGDTQTRPFTIQDGLVTRMTHLDGYTTFEYDRNRRLVKSEIYVKSRLNSYYTQEWADGRPAGAILPKLKGFPDIQPAFGETGVLQAYQYYAQAGDTLARLNNSTYASQVNAQNLVISTSGTITFPHPGQQVINRTDTYGYTNCQ